MAPAAERPPSIEPSSEYDDFITKLKDFHEKRGTTKTFETQPKVGTPARRVDLLKLYKRVVHDGGYDEVSNTRSHKLYWRNLGQEFELGDANFAALAFNLKTAYYKNLVAYEIVHVHKKEPPPKEILEEVSAKGGDVMNRTVENFHRPMSRDGVFLNGVHVDGDDDENPNTPGGDAEEGGIGRRLRQAPAQRQLFQSDMTYSRQNRQPSGQHGSPVPHQTVQHHQPQPPSYTTYASAAGSFGSNGSPSLLAAYEPRYSQPLTLRPVTTPANNFETFKSHQRQIRERNLAQLRKFPNRAALKQAMPPGTGFPGPSIYYRALLSLQSRVIEEQEYALHHLVKISHERGDKYRFDSFQGLAEGLVTKVLEVGDLFAGANWHVSYSDDPSIRDPDALDGLNGTKDALQRAQNPRKRKLADRVEPEIYARRLNLINEAGLVMRNMVMLEENCRYLATMPAVKDMIVLVLNLAEDATLVELKVNVLEIAEQVVKYISPKEDDQLFDTLVHCINSSDRANITTGLRSLCRLGSEVGHLARLQNVPHKIVQNVCNWVLVEDEDLRGACLDFLFQYTVLADNVEKMMQEIDVDGLVKQLVRLLLHNPRVEESESSSKPPPPTPTTPIQDIPIPKIPQDLIDQLLVYDEPERSSQWLRACFEEDIQGEITQISLWHAYQVPFAQYNAQRPLLPAKDFITNVSNTFQTASAQVVQGPNNTQRFVIKGIKARLAPVDPKGRTYMRCQWHVLPAKTDPSSTQPGQPAAPATPRPVPAPNKAAASNSTPAPATPSTAPVPAPTPAPAEPPAAQPQEPQECGEFALWPKHMWEHVVTKHLGVTKGEDGRYVFEGAPTQQAFRCSWAGCPRFDAAPVDAFAVGMHLKTHLPDSSEAAYRRSKHNSTRKIDAAAASGSLPSASADSASKSWTRTWQTQNTMVDERADAAGLPLMSVLVLRNLAKYLPGGELGRTKGAQQDGEGKDGAEAAHAPTSPTGQRAGSRHEPGSPDARRFPRPTAAQLERNMVWRVFAPVMEQMYYVLAYNDSLRNYVTEVLARVERACG